MTTSPGTPLPLGSTPHPDGVNFAVYINENHSIKLILYSAPDRQTPTAKIETIGVFDIKRTGNIRHIFVEGALSGMLYLYEVDGKIVLDPYAKEIYTAATWNKGTGPYKPYGVIPSYTQYDWEDDKPPLIAKESLIIYEMHLRGFTADSSSFVRFPGSYLAMIEKIPYLKDLGINAVEILPLFEFDEKEYSKVDPFTDQTLCNYWGYSTVNFFSPMSRYAASTDLGAAQSELKSLIKELHKNQIEVFLDVVYNHTAEGNENGPLISFKGLDDGLFYLFDEQKNYLNFSGCGNTLKCNHPIVQELIIASLRHWVIEFHVDGFRFDLASILSRGTDGTPLLRPPLIEAITRDPVLSKVKLIAEAWDAAGLYQVGHFFPSGEGRWSEWNGIYRDSVRNFIKGGGQKGDFATRLCGSNDIYYSQGPLTSINFITSHDGFTLADLVSYNQKHNFNNAEQNRDGSSCNDSWNCGMEGPSLDPAILRLREKQIRNFYIALLTSQGIPMLHMGDEYGHTKMGNNNTWCQDNQLSWFLWGKISNNSLLEFVKSLIRLRKSMPHFLNKNFWTEENIKWHGKTVTLPDWGCQDGLLAFTLLHPECNLYVAFNAGDESQTIELPPAKNTWDLLANTGELSPNDFPPSPQPYESKSICLSDHSSVILREFL